MKIFEKKMGLENTLKNFDQSFKEIIKKNIKTKEEFKKDLLEKVYPIGSYYWSDRNISPENIFGGKWEKIYGRFLFASDYNHSPGTTGGEERVTLRLSEIPPHEHQYDKFYWAERMSLYYDGETYGYAPGYSMRNNNNHDTSQARFTKRVSTGIAGSNCSHNNMPPFLAANCWKRTG